MFWTIERLRLAIIAVAVVLLVSIFGSFLYARWRLRHIGQDIPARLGIQIQQSTHGFVFSKTEQGRTVFTLHAARAVQFKSGGRADLHDVEIDMYSRQDGQADTIAGSDFQFDPHSQIVQSQGETQIMLHAPEKSGAGEPSNKNGRQIIRITTHGLVFNQKTGVATCTGEVDFHIADSSGQAVGAEYDSKQGRLLLQSKVVLMTTMQNRPGLVRASQAIYDRNENEVHLQQPRYSPGLQPGTRQGERGMAGTATVFLRADGSAKQLDARNGVQLISADGTMLRAAAMNAQLNPNNQPEQAHFSGGVQFTQSQPRQTGIGSAHEAIIYFDPQGRARRAAFDFEVQFHQQIDAGQNRLQRTLHSNHLILYLFPATTGQSQVQAAHATGNAVFTSQSSVPGRPQQETQVAADILKATFLAGNELQHIEGAGQTVLLTVATNGDIDSSAGETLSIDFLPVPSQSAKQISLSPRLAASAAAPVQRSGDTMATESIRTAVQTGNVVLKQTTNPRSNETTEPQVSTAIAARAEYRSGNDTLTLTGKPVFHNAQLEMRANRMEVQHATGKMLATGAVQATLRFGREPQNAQLGGLLDAGNQPVHIIADQATLMHNTQTAIFTGHARLWQGSNMVEAPVIELSQKMQTLLAYSNDPCTGCVHSTFLGQSPGTMRAGQQAISKNSGSATLPSIFRIVSERLLYSDAEHKASFLGTVEVASSSGEMFADHAEIFLIPAPEPPLANHGEKERNLLYGSNNPSQSSVERIVATGHVRLVQPGRRGTGARLVYTADDGHFVLTGDNGRQPEIVDADHGKVTGQVLTFASQEQAIIVSGTSSHTTTAETRVQRK